MSGPGSPLIVIFCGPGQPGQVPVWRRRDEVRAVTFRGSAPQVTALHE